MKINCLPFNCSKMLLSAFLFGLLCFSCGNDSKSDAHSQAGQQEEESPASDENDIASPEDLPESMTTLQTNEQVYAWVDNLNVRDKASLTGKVVTKVTEQEALAFTGEKSAETEIIVLRGVAYDEPWLKIRTGDGKEGWVFGGAVKRQSESKGNDPINDDRFFFPHFGRFDLSTWKKVDSNDESGGDAAITVATYTKGQRTLVVEKSDVGEYGYSRRDKLIENDGKVLKTRHFEFVGDGINELNETVNVYTSSPPKKYTRTQKLGKHFMQLNARPVMAYGAWVESAADVLPASLDIGIAPNKCPGMDNDSGCSCNFKSEGNEVFVSDFNNACMTVDGKTVSLSATDFEDERTKLYNQSLAKNWIILNEKGDDTIFGKKLQMASKYEAHREELIQTLLVMDEMPGEIPYQSNGTVGMGYRAEIGDMCREAVEMAKAARQRGETGPPTEMRFLGADYNAHFRVKSTGRDDGGGNYYEGTMEVQSKDGKVLGTRNVTGYCGC